MAVLCVMLSVVCIADYRRMKIPNWLVLLIFMYGLGYRLQRGGTAGAAEWLFNSTVIFAVTYPLFKIGAVGAGDVKLFAVTCGCLPRDSLSEFILVTLLIAAVISIFKLCREQNVRERFRYFREYVVEVCRTGHFGLYWSNVRDARRSGICLAGPVFVSIVFHMGGVY